MLHKPVPAAIAVLLLALAAPHVSTAQESEVQSSNVYQRSYPLSNLSSYTAELLVLKQCPGGQADYDRCRVLDANSERIVVAADATIHQKVAEALQKASEPKATPRFQIVLVRAHKNGEGIDPALPDNVHAALDDASTLLPYTAYELVDTGLVRSQRTAELHLVDAEGQKYDVSLSFSLEPDPEGLRIDFHRFQLAHRGSLDGETQRAGLLLSTTFDMALGETLVVGTSKLNGGGEALMALVTAVGD